MPVTVQFFTRKARQFKNHESGVAAIEYALIASAVVLGIVTAVGNIGSNLSATYSTIAGMF
ncbi:MAG TPA: Flp family type IVb pilin [Rhizobiales bacterium]|nr:Flp family type IVb pilin [Hyphomicrobiales bacterium]